MLSSRYVRNGFLLAVILIYILVRVWRLDASCLWFDEVFSVHAAEHDWISLLQFAALDLVHPPLFYAVLKAWIGFGGEGLYWLRLLPVVFSCLALIPLKFLTNEMEDSGVASKWLAILTIFLTAVNGSLIKYSQEVRMYSMLMFLSLMSIWLFFRLKRRGATAWLIVINILMVYTHYYGWLVIGTEVLAVALFYRTKLRSVFGMLTVVSAAFAPWIIAVASAARSGSDLGQNIQWMERPGLISTLVFALRQLEPFYFQVSKTDPFSAYLISVPIAILITIAAILWLTKAVAEERKEGAFRLLLIFSIFPICTAAAASWLLPYSVWGTRHLVIIAAPTLILVSTIILDLPFPRVRLVLISLIVMFSGYAALDHYRHPAQTFVWCGWEPLVTDLAQLEKESIAVYTNENLIAYHAWFATRHRNGIIVTALEGMDAPEDGTYFLPRGFEAVRKSSIDDVREPHIILLYRTEAALITDKWVQAIKTRGYTACPPRVVQYGPSTAFRMELTREPGVCIYPY
jgi:uncharacterized membrane protein